MDEARTGAALFQHFGDHGFLADMAVGDVRDGDPGLRRQRRGTLAHLIAQPCGKLRIVENANVVGVEEARHAFGIAHARKGSRHHHPIIAGQNAGNPIIVAIRQRAHCQPLDIAPQFGRY